MKPKMTNQELIKGIRLYNPYCEHITLCTIFSKMHLGRFNISNYGSPGTGKSESTLELLNRLNLGNDIKIDNTITERGLFQQFQDFPNHDIIIDECNALLKNPAAQDMIKLAMEGKSLVWTKNNSSEKTPPFEGNIILNANVPITEAIVDRCFMNKTIMNREMTLGFIDYYLIEQKEEEKINFVKYIKERILDRNKPVLTEEELKFISDFTKSNIKDSDQELGYSRRCIKKMILYFLCVKKLFGSFDKEVIDFIMPYAQLYVINDNIPSLVEAIVSDGEIDKAELIRKVANAGGYSERNARRLVDKGIAEGSLILWGRMVKKKVN